MDTPYQSTSTSRNTSMEQDAPEISQSSGSSGPPTYGKVESTRNRVINQAQINSVKQNKPDK